MDHAVLAREGIDDVSLIVDAGINLLGATATQQTDVSLPVKSVRFHFPSRLGSSKPD